MSRLDPPTTGNPPETPAAAPHTNGDTCSASHATGQAGPNAAQAGPQQGEQPSADANRINRAEELVDRLAVGVASFTSVWGRRIMRMGSRIREEAQDIWAEAQSIRRGDQQ